jgi:hypothetical protein
MSQKCQSLGAAKKSVCVGNALQRRGWKRATINVAKPEPPDSFIAMAREVEAES